MITFLQTQHLQPFFEERLQYDNLKQIKITEKIIIVLCIINGSELTPVTGDEVAKKKHLSSHNAKIHHSWTNAGSSHVLFSYKSPFSYCKAAAQPQWLPKQQLPIQTFQIILIIKQQIHKIIR